MVDGVHRMEEGAIGVVRISVGARRLHIRAPRSEALAPVVWLLPPVGGRCHSELGAEPLVGSGIVGVLIPRIGRPQGGRLLAPQADASSYNRHESDTDLRERGLYLGDGHQQSPRSQQSRTRGRN